MATFGSNRFKRIEKLEEEWNGGLEWRSFSYDENSITILKENKIRCDFDPFSYSHEF